MTDEIKKEEIKSEPEKWQPTKEDWDWECELRNIIIKDSQNKSRAIGILLPLVKEEDIVKCLAKLSKLQQEKGDLERKEKENALSIAPKDRTDAQHRLIIHDKYKGSVRDYLLSMGSFKDVKM